jgi:hypothetical protein
VGVSWGLTRALCVRVSIMFNRAWKAAVDSDVAEMERLVGQDPGLLDTGDRQGWTLLMWASSNGHLGVMRCLIDNAAAVNGRSHLGQTALWLACCNGRPPVVSLLLERGADPTTALLCRKTPLMSASEHGCPEILDLLLGHPGAKSTINYRGYSGGTALWAACNNGQGGAVRALLKSGADPTIANSSGITPMAIAMQPDSSARNAEGRRACVAALEVSCPHLLSPPPSTFSLSMYTNLGGS